METKHKWEIPESLLRDGWTEEKIQALSDDEESPPWSPVVMTDIVPDFQPIMAPDIDLFREALADDEARTAFDNIISDLDNALCNTKHAAKAVSDYDQEYALHLIANAQDKWKPGPMDEEERTSRSKDLQTLCEKVSTLRMRKLQRFVDTTVFRKALGQEIASVFDQITQAKEKELDGSITKFEISADKLSQSLQDEITKLNAGTTDPDEECYVYGADGDLQERESDIDEMNTKDPSLDDRTSPVSPKSDQESEGAMNVLSSQSSESAHGEPGDEETEATTTDEEIGNGASAHTAAAPQAPKPASGPVSAPFPPLSLTAIGVNAFELRVNALLLTATSIVTSTLSAETRADQLEYAARNASDAYVLSHRADDQASTARCRFYQGLIAFRRGNVAEAQGYFAEAAEATGSDDRGNWAVQWVEECEGTLLCSNQGSAARYDFAGSDSSGSPRTPTVKSQRHRSQREYRGEYYSRRKR
ncbi:hypothetical protein MBLNU459_g6566t1 [Dothideomycetes sp. NU459]